MAREDLPKALERFGQIDNRLARKYEGTGLGLPLAKQLVELHEGIFEMQSELGIGSTVTITFPRERTIACGALHQAEIIPIARAQAVKAAG
jgi:two-component system cell cycle sensor histidine kinase PleC